MTQEFNDKLWEDEITVWEHFKNPDQPLNFQERITRELMLQTSKMNVKEALNELERVEDIILEHPVKAGYFTLEFLKGVRAHNKGVTATLRTKILGKYNTGNTPNNLLKDAFESYAKGNEKDALKLVGEIGALMLDGKDLLTPLESEIDGKLRDFLRGAKTTARMAKLYNIKV